MSEVRNMHDHPKVLFTVPVVAGRVTVSSYAFFYELCSQAGISWEDVAIEPHLGEAKVSVTIAGDLIERKNTVIRLLREAHLLDETNTEGAVVPFR